MVVTAGGFAQPLRVLFSPLFALRRVCNPAPLCGGLLSEGACVSTRYWHCANWRCCWLPCSPEEMM
nr:hypothetical protein [Edwardsiella ictaluri]